MKSAITISLVAQAQGGPFVFWDNLAAGCERAAALGFDAVEIFAPSADSIDRKSLHHLLDRHNLEVAAMGSGAGWLIHRWDLCQASEEIRQKSRKFIAQIIDLAGEFSSPAIIGSMQGRIEGGVSRQQALEWLREALNDLSARAANHGQPLLFEPLNRYETNAFNRLGDTAAFIHTLDTQNVKILADLFHMNIEETSIPDALRAAGKTIGHVHFADSNRQAVGYGHTAMEPVVEALRQLAYTGYLSAEILPQPDSEAAAKQTMKAYRRFVAQEPAN